MTHREKIGCMAADGSPIDLSEAMIFEWDIEQDRITCTQSNGVEVCIRDVCFDTDQADSTFLRIHPEDIPALAEFRNRVRQGNLYSMSEFRWKDSEERYTWCRIYAIIRYDGQKKPVKAVGSVWNIQKEKQRIQKLRYRAEKDALTGVYNREETEKRIKRYLEMHSDNQCALFMIDTDNFKQINDTKGHMLGDVVLTEMASGMKKLMRESDIVGRIGGDEFAIFMKNIPSSQAAEKRAGELSEMFAHLFEDEKQEVQVTCSIGIAL